MPNQHPTQSILPTGHPADGQTHVVGRNDRAATTEQGVSRPSVEAESLASATSTATLVDPPTLEPSSSPSPSPVKQEKHTVTLVAAPPAWRHLWPVWSHPANNNASAVSPAGGGDSLYVAIPTHDHLDHFDDTDSDADSNAYIDEHTTTASRRRRPKRPRPTPQDLNSHPSSGWRTCGLLLLALLLVKSLALLALLAAILFTLGPLARHHHKTNNGDDTGGRVAQLDINHIHVHNWTLDAYADPVANVDLSATMLVTDSDASLGHDAWWAKWIKWVNGHVEVGEAVYDIWLENPLHAVETSLMDKVMHDVHQAPETDSRQSLPSLVKKVLADTLAEQGDNPHEPSGPAVPVLIGTATVPAFRPHLSAKLIDASIQDVSIALDPSLVFKWLSPFANLGSQAPPMRLRLVGSPKVSVGWVGKPIKVSGLAKVDTAAAFRASYDWKAEDIHFDPGTLLSRNTLKSTAALLSPLADKDKDDDPPVPTEYLLHFTLTFLNPHPLSLQLPLALSMPIYSHDEHDNDPLAHLVGAWLEAPGLTIPASSSSSPRRAGNEEGQQRAQVPMTLRIPTAKLPKVFSMLQQYHRGERVSVQVGPGTQMTPGGRLAGVVAKAHGIVSVQKGHGQGGGANGLDQWVAQAGRKIVESVVEWGKGHLVRLE